MSNGPIPLPSGADTSRFLYGAIDYTVGTSTVEIGGLPAGARLLNVYVDQTELFDSDDTNNMAIWVTLNAELVIDVPVAYVDLADPPTGHDVDDHPAMTVNGFDAAPFGTKDHRPFAGGGKVQANIEYGTPTGGLPDAGQAYIIVEYLPLRPYGAETTALS